MPANASGTPTTNYGFYTLNPSVDAPNGTGLNTIITSIDTELFAKVIGKALLTTTGDMLYASAASTPARLAAGTSGYVLTANGAGVAPSWAAPAASFPAPATSLPGSPSDGQATIYTDSLTAPTYHWLLIYEASTSKWMYAGGTPMSHHVVTSEAPGSSGSWVDLATAGPTLTTPLAGDWIASFGARISQGGVANQTNLIGIKVGAAAVGNAQTGGLTAQNTGFGAASVYGPAGDTALAGVAASTVIKVQYNSSGNTSSAFANRYLHLTPVKVS
jgi:hypothetical protein